MKLLILFSFEMLRLMLLADGQQLTQDESSRLSYIAVIADIRPTAELKSDTALYTRLKSLSNDVGNSVFQLATSPASRMKTHLGRYAAANRSLLSDEHTRYNATFLKTPVEVQPIFIRLNDSEDMRALINAAVAEKNAANNKTGRLSAVLEMSPCSASSCYEMEEMIRHLPRNVPFFSTCCFERNNATTIYSEDRGPKKVYIAMEPRGLSRIVYHLAHKYQWRRFHFVISPEWPNYDLFYKELRDEFDKLEQFEKFSFGQLIVTQSYFCTRYLALGGLCSANQAQDILLRTATATFLLLDSQRDVPEFMRQLGDISKTDSSLLSGKALFLLNLPGILARVFDEVVSNAPDGLMIVRQRRSTFPDYPPAKMFGVDGVGVDASLFAQTRMISKAIEIYEQSPDDYHSVSDLFCGTEFTFDDNANPIGYSEVCDRDRYTLEVFNVKRDTQNNTFRVDQVFTLKDGVMTLVGEPHWIGSRNRAPVEDFCKLDGAGCPPPPLDLRPILGPSISGFLAIALSIGIVIWYVDRKARLQRERDEMVRKMVIIDGSEIAFDRGTMSRSTELGPLAKARVLHDNDEADLLKLKLRGGNYGDNRAKPSLAQIKALSQKSGRAQHNGEAVFFKLCKKNELKADQSLVQELLQVRDLHHQNVNAFLGVVIEPTRVYEINGWCAKGTLDRILHPDEKPDDRVRLERTFKISFANDIAKGMAYLHKSNIKSHGRLSARNVVVDARWVCKITNIPIHSIEKEESSKSGSASRASRSTNRTSDSSFDSKTGVKRKNRFGFAKKSIGDLETAEFDESADFLYMAPELLREPRKERPLRGTCPGDAYSFGILLHEIVSRQRPFETYHLPERMLFEKIQRAHSGHFRPSLKIAQEENVHELVSLAKICWEEQTDKRPTFSAVCKDLKELNHGRDNNLVDQMMAMLEEKAEGLEVKVHEERKLLEMEKKRTHDIMQRIMPKQLVNDVLAGRQVMPEHFDSATVLFANIADFGQIVETRPPNDIVMLLETFCQHIDKLIESKDVYKMNQLGCRFELASGIPKRNGNKHLTDIADLALEMMSFVAGFENPLNRDELIQFRCGIDTGAVLGAVAGTRYCIFGETVDNASKLESNGMPLRIHVSDEAAKYLEDTGKYFIEEIDDSDSQLRSGHVLVGKQGFSGALPAY